MSDVFILKKIFVNRIIFYISIAFYNDIFDYNSIPSLYNLWNLLIRDMAKKKILLLNNFVRSSRTSNKHVRI